MTHCDKCLQDDEQTDATHNCSTCNLNFCEGHLSFHNSSAKTKSHSTQSLGKAKTVNFSGNFDLVCKLGDKDDININFVYPVAITLDVKNQLLFVADNYSILVFDAKSHLFKYKFDAPKEEYITCMRIDYNSNAIVFCNCRRWVTKMSLDGKSVFFHKVFQNESGDFHSLLVDSDSTIYLLVTGYRDAKIKSLNGKDGSELNSIGMDMNGNSLLSNATMLAFNSDGNFLIGDGSPSYQLVTMTRKGKVLKKEDRTHNYGRIGDILVLDNGDVMVVEKTSGECQIELISKEGGVKKWNNVNGKKFEGHTLGIAYNSQTGELFVVSLGNLEVYVVK